MGLSGYTSALFSLLAVSNIFSQDLIFHKAADGLMFPEGPAYDGKKTLYVSNCHGDFVTRLIDNKQDIFAKVPASPAQFQKTNGMTVHKDGFIYACEYEIGKIVRFSPEGECFDYAVEYEGESFNRPNDLAFDKDGNLYFTDPKSYGEDLPDGRVFRVVRESGEVELIADELCFPNGIAIDPDHESIFICESAKNRVLKYKLNSDGTISDQEEFVHLPGGDPDGIAFDSEGNLWIAHFGTGSVCVVNKSGEILKQYKAPGQKPTNLEFTGEDMKTLYLTEVETNSVYYAKVDVPGLVLYGLKD